MCGEVVEEALLMTFVDNKLSHGISALINTCMYVCMMIIIAPLYAGAIVLNSPFIH